MGAQLMEPGLELYLVQILNRAATQPFAWGRNDCNTLALTWVDHLCGTHYLGTVLNSYCCAKSAIQYAQSMPRWCNGLSELGWHEIPRNEARQGDLAVVEDERFDRVHIVTGRHVVSVDETLNFVRLEIDALPGARFWSFA
jgi:hypothetical protein